LAPIGSAHANREVREEREKKTKKLISMTVKSKADAAQSPQSIHTLFNNIYTHESHINTLKK
uniref:Uncharacterized protein n=1 Tax=Denticeps clupeoides TaxID=299321 RepID=A0AAY4B6V4_9TELE